MYQIIYQIKTKWQDQDSKYFLVTGAFLDKFYQK